MRAGWDGYSPGKHIRFGDYYLCKKHLSLTVRMTVPAPNFLAADVFGTGVFH